MERLQQTGAGQGNVPLWDVLRVTTDAMTLAQGLMQCWQAQQAATQAGLTTWRHHTQTLETTGVILQCQAETLQAQAVQLHRAPWWAFLAGVGLMGLVALGMGRLTAPPGAAGAITPVAPDAPGGRATVRGALQDDAGRDPGTRNR